MKWLPSHLGAGLVSGILAFTISAAAAQVVHDKSDMPSLVQLDFGPYGSKLPDNGENYCFPTTGAMLFMWMGQHGYSQLAPESYSSEEELQAFGLNLDRVFAGLMNTSGNGGTTNQQYIDGIDDYLRAKGVLPDDRHWEQNYSPTMEWFNQHNDANTVVLAGLSWYWPESSDTDHFSYSGGHGVALVMADPNLTSDNMVVNNPFPSTFYNVPDVPSSNPLTITVTTTPTNWHIEYDHSPPYLQITTPIVGQPGYHYAILDNAISLRLSDTAKPNDANYTVHDWEINTLKWLNTNGGNLEVIAALTGTGGLHKRGEGELVLRSTNSLSGTNIINAGALVSTATSGTPFGTGSIVMNGQGQLAFRPDDTTPADIALVAASGTDQRLHIEGSAGQITLDSGSNTSLSVTIGGYTSGTERNILLTDQATLVIATNDSWATLGDSVKLFAAGGAGNHPEPHANGMLSGAWVAQNNDADLSGAFVTYKEATGIELAETVDGDINTVGSTAIYATATDQTVEGSASVYALSVIGAKIDGDALYVGPQTGETAGIILNGGTISTTALNYQSADLYIYTSHAPAAISSAIGGTGAFTTFGPGELVLTGNSSATLLGNTFVNSGTLHIRGGQTGSSETTVRNGAKLIVSDGGSVGGNVVVKDNAQVSLDEGTITGGINVNSLGTLVGSGTISGTSSITGALRGLEEGGGTMTFEDSVVFENGSQFFFLLTNTTTAAEQAGIAWNTLNFEGAVELGNTQSPTTQALTIYLEFLPSIGPDSGNSFWESEHRWTFATGQSGAFEYADASVGNWGWYNGTFGLEYNETYDLAMIVYTPYEPIPEPSTYALFGIGLGSLILFRRRKAAQA